MQEQLVQEEQQHQQQQRRRRVPRSGKMRVTTGAAAAAVAILPDEPRRVTRAAAKRAAADDGSRAASAAAFPAADHPKKRPALADLSRHSNIPVLGSSANNNNASKAVKLRPVNNASASTQESSDEIQSKENISSRNVPLGSRNFQGTIQQPPQPQVPNTSASASIASLQRRALQSLYISKNSKPGNSSTDVSMDEVSGWSEKKLSYVDIDSEHHNDPQMCSLYAPEIYQHLRTAELKRRPAVNFMAAVQRDINPSMRAILVDWLVEVAEEYKLAPDTLYLTINYIDRYLSANVVNRQRLQLLGVACMLIASKYEEICAPQVDEFCYITDNTYARDELLQMERAVLNYLRFDLTTPTAKSFLRRFVRAAHASGKPLTYEMDFLGNYLTELTLVEYGFLRFLPSIIAASAVFLARLTLEPSSRPWNATLKHYSGYASSQLKDCVLAIHELQLNTKNCTLPAIRDKYNQPKFKNVASLAPPATVPQEYFEGHD